MNFCMYPIAFQKLTNSTVALEKPMDLSRKQNNFECLKTEWAKDPEKRLMPRFQSKTQGAIYREQWQKNTKLQYVLA